MKFEKFLLAIRVLNYVLNHPRCTIPQIRDSFGVDRSNPPQQEEKNLYTITSYLKNSGLIKKIEINSIIPGGAHFYLRTTQKGFQAILTIEKIFGTSQLELLKQRLTISDREHIRTFDDLSTEFSVLAYEVLKGLLQELISEIPLDARRFLLSKRAKLNALLKKSHTKLQEKVSNIIDSLI